MSINPVLLHSNEMLHSGRLRAGRALLLADLEHDVHAVPDLPDDAHGRIGERPARCG
jgi:hypothetical protein